MTTDGALGAEGSDPPAAGTGPEEGTGGRSRAVLYSTLAVAVVLAVLIAVLAASKPASHGAASSPLVGNPAPPVAGPSLSGGATYSLSQFRGRWVLVNFSASWCEPCRQETPQLLRFENEHAATGNAVILAVSFDPQDKANLAAFLRSSHATWPAINDPGAEVAYGIQGIPESYLVDPQGTVVAKFTGGVTAAQVDGVIKQATGA
ncbi:MAG TPA: TlpA disulfide reductase family protein [Acidimicrobiales bacterium]|nr:TlpA disulfide reductase family protein [Acidimicrobiales bacterium]